MSRDRSAVVRRRQFLKAASLGVFGLSLPELLRLEALADPTVERRRADAVILFWLGGGHAHIDMWDMKPNAPANVRGAFRPIDTRVPGLQVCEHLPMLAQVADKFTILRSLHHTTSDHGPGATYMLTGNRPPNGAGRPNAAVGAYAARTVPAEPGVPPYVLVGGPTSDSGPSYLGSAYGPFGASATSGRLGLPQGFSTTDLDNRTRLLNSLNAGFNQQERSSALVDSLDVFQRQAIASLTSNLAREAFDLSREPAASHERYGRSAFGQGALLARRLVEAGVRFITVNSLGNWDTHINQFPAMQNNLLPSLDRILSALLEDLDQRGLLRRTLVLCTGEFGRTPRVNSAGGRDHYGSSIGVLLAGGGIKRGYVHGSTDATCSRPVNDPCTPEDLYTTMFHCLGVPADTRLPNAQGQLAQLFTGGAIVQGLLA